MNADLSEIRDCARCGETHSRLLWKSFDRPTKDGYDWWATCPVSGDPILMKVEPMETADSLTAKARKRFKEATNAG